MPRDPTECRIALLLTGGHIVSCATAYAIGWEPPNQYLSFCGYGPR